MKLHLFIISITTIIIWYPLTRLILKWESYTYLTEHFYRILFTDPWNSFGNFDVQSMLIGSILAKLIGINIPMYFWVEIFFILIINISVYFLTKTLTKNVQTAFVASFIFAVYFFGMEFYAPNYYATFLQRIIFNVPLLLASLIFLHRYLVEGKLVHYTISFVLFFVSIFIARFEILLSFPILLYPFFWKILQRFNFRFFFRGLLIASPFIIITVFFLQIQRTYGDNIGPKHSFLYFLTHPEIFHYLEGTIRQLVYMSQYPSVIQAIKLSSSPFSFIDASSSYRFATPIVFTYIFAIIVIWLKNKKQRALLLTIIFSIIFSLVLNIYFDRFDVLNNTFANRYYYYPSILLAIFWSLLLTAFFRKNRFFAVCCILIGFFLINAALFRQYFIEQTQFAKITKKLYEYIVSNNSQFPSGSFIIVGPTADFGPYETGFLTDQLGKKRNIIFVTENLAYGDWSSQASVASTVLKIYYDKKCSCIQKKILR